MTRELAEKLSLMDGTALQLILALEDFFRACGEQVKHPFHVASPLSLE